MSRNHRLERPLPFGYLSPATRSHWQKSLHNNNNIIETPICVRLLCDFIYRYVTCGVRIVLYSDLRCIIIVTYTYTTCQRGVAVYRRPYLVFVGRAPAQWSRTIYTGRRQFGVVVFIHYYNIILGASIIFIRIK